MPRVGSITWKSNLPQWSLVGITALLFASFLLVNLVGSYLAGAYAWDDGAITLAYARTLAEHGVFALTSSSEIVEGSSSLLLTFLMALLHGAFDLSFDEFIRASQVTSFVWVLLLVLLLFRSLQGAVPDPVQRALIVLLLGSLPMFTAEVFNGMEMSLFALLLAAMTLAFDSRSRWIFLLIPLVLLCRFESIFYLAFAFLLLWFIEPEERRRMTVLCAYLVAVFALVTLFRWLYFDDVLPNPIWAKMNPPYSKGRTPLLVLARKLQGAEEFLSVQSFLLVASLGLLVFRETWRRRLDLKVLLVLAIGAFALITGPVAGYAGRMSLACLPLLVLIARDTLSQAPSRGSVLELTCSSLKITAQRQVVAVAVALALAGTHLANRGLFEANAFTAAYGAHFQDRLQEPFDALVEGRIRSESAPPSWYGVSPANYRITGEAAEGIRSLLNLRSLKIMVPDVGGLGLCCDRLDVIDSALLTNRFLARNGWAAFDEYLQRVVPDVIVTHDPWSRLSGIYDSAFFADNYEPLVFENNLLWIHRQNASRLLASPRVAKTRLRDLDLLDQVRYGNGPLDREYIAARQPGFLWAVRMN